VGGLGAGHGPVALFLTFLIVIGVGYLTVTRIDVEDPQQVAGSQAAARNRHGLPQQPGNPASSRHAPRRPDPPRAYPARPGPPRPAPPQDEWLARDERAARDQRLARDERPGRERQPSRRSWDFEDETEAERTAEGFFAWDE
jgi:cell division protein FtsN